MIEELNGDFLQWLRGFYYVSQTGSIRRAAQMMNRNPSTISYQIRSLEEELNTVLFDRYKKSLRITPEGKKLFEWTVYTFETLRGLRSEVGTLSGKLQGTVTFSSNLPFAAQIVGIISGFRERHPDVNIRIRRALTYEVVDDVESSKVDFGLRSYGSSRSQRTGRTFSSASPAHRPPGQHLSPSQETETQRFGTPALRFVPLGTNGRQRRTLL